MGGHGSSRLATNPEYGARSGGSDSWSGHGPVRLEKFIFPARRNLRDFGRPVRKRAGEFRGRSGGDDHAYFRQKLRTLIEARAGWVCCEAADESQAIEMHSSTQPDVTLVDLHMPGVDEFKTSRQILDGRADAKILMVTLFGSRHHADEARRVGLKGCCSKNSYKNIVGAVEAVLRGDTYFPEFIE